MKNGQNVNNLPDVQLPIQNCTTVQYFVVHATYGAKSYQVSFPTQQTSYHLDFPRWSYCQITEDCTEDQQPRKITSGIQFEEAFSYTLLCLFISISCLPPATRDVPSINMSLLHSKWRLLIIEMQNPFVQLCANKYSE